MDTAVTTTRIDGMEVSWRTVPGRLRATLIFRVGVVDEEFHTLGTAHLVEHLAFAETEDLDPDVNGSVGVQTTHFSVEGTPQKVVRQLESVCRSLSALAEAPVPSAPLEHEKRILDAEGDVVALPDPAVGEALTLRYGLQGPGLAAVAPLFTEKISGEEVRDLVRRYFTRGNATLVLTGEPPVGLTLPLPDGARVPVPEHDPIPLDLPGEYTSGGEDLVLSFQVPGTRAGQDAVGRLVLTALRRRSFRELRRGAAVIYDLEVGVALQPRSGVAVVVIRTADSSVRQAAAGVLEILRDLRDHGVTDVELEAARQEVRDEADDADHDLEALFDEAEGALVGESRPSLAELAVAMGSVTAADVRDWLAQLDPTLAVGIPEDAYPDEPEPGSQGLVATVMGPSRGPEIAGAVYPVRLLARIGGAPKGMKLVVGEHGVLLSAGTVQRSLAWGQIAAVQEDDSDPDLPQLNLIGRSGDVIEVQTAAFKGGEKAVEQILAQVPPRLRTTTGEPSLSAP